MTYGVEDEVRAESNAARQLAAVMALRVFGSLPQILLVTSRRSSRWVLPKGGIRRGSSPSETASREAWEEAGILGPVSASPVGSYGYVKNDRHQLVHVYLMHVHRIENRWPERCDRLRRWFTFEEAILHAGHSALADLIRSLQPGILGHVRSTIIKGIR